MKDGILLIDKPAGWTSFDVVAKVRSILKKSQTPTPISQPPFPKPKVGHTGTLDPFATGLLILTVGKATKRAQEFSKLDKVYEATVELGKTSSTGDPEGVLTEVKAWVPDASEVHSALNKFIGETMQTPPMYSAIKIGGQRAYKLARKGQTAEIEPRKVTIYSLELISYNYPDLKIRAHVSSGTYIRTLAEDIGKALATGAYTKELRRTKVGDYDVKNAHKINFLTEANILNHLTKLDLT